MRHGVVILLHHKTLAPEMTCCYRYALYVVHMYGRCIMSEVSPPPLEAFNPYFLYEFIFQFMILTVASVLVIQIHMNYVKHTWDDTSLQVQVLRVTSLYVWNQTEAWGRRGEGGGGKRGGGGGTSFLSTNKTPL